MRLEPRFALWVLLLFTIGVLLAMVLPARSAEPQLAVRYGEPGEVYLFRPGMLPELRARSEFPGARVRGVAGEIGQDVFVLRRRADGSLWLEGPRLSLELGKVNGRMEGRGRSRVLLFGQRRLAAPTPDSTASADFADFTARMMRGGRKELEMLPEIREALKH